MGAATTGTTSVQSAPLQTARKDPGKPARPSHHSVQRGETLSSIADDFQCDLRVLARNNAIKAPRYTVRQGQRLKLAGCGE
jgi:membrane-bound lytic murein transglycosylase D